MKKIVLTAFILLFASLQGFAAHWTENKTISVYIEPNAKEYSMKKAFNKWETRANGLISFKFVNSKDNAEIKVIMVEQIGGSVAGLCSRQTNGNIITGATIQLSKNIRGAAQYNNDYYRTMLHEIGHALGLDHTNRLNSIMNPTTDYAQMITGKDLQDLENLYENN